jgi:drug/metabolite transporter (DMT)-like permease
MPVTALIYGAAILDEPLRPTMLGGLGLILGGVALGSGSGGRSGAGRRAAGSSVVRMLAPGDGARTTPTSSSSC